MSCSSTQSTSAHDDSKSAAHYYLIADTGTCTQERRAHKRTLASRRDHGECKRRQHVMVADIHWADQSRPSSLAGPQRQRQTESTTPLCPVHQPELSNQNDQAVFTKQTGSELHLHQSVARHKIKCVLKEIAAHDHCEARRESARLMLEMMPAESSPTPQYVARHKIQGVLNEIAAHDHCEARRESARVMLEMMPAESSPTNLDSDSNVSALGHHKSDWEFSAHSLSSTCESTAWSASSAWPEEPLDNLPK